jgi:dual oxidase
MTSWIDGSFVYSTKEAWVNAMRTFENGTFRMVGDIIMGMPPFNTQRIPIFNMPSPNVLKMQSPERMYRKSFSLLPYSIVL